jgi:hypothetical protein
MMKIYPFLFVLFFGYASQAQILMFPPYVKITNTISGRTFKLKEGKAVRFATRQDSIVKRSRLTEIHEDFLIFESLVTRQRTKVYFDDIAYLEFQPKSKLRRFVKLGYYLSWAGVVLYASSLSCNDPGCVNSGMVAILLTPVMIGVGEVGGVVMQALTRKREFYKGVNLKIN